MRILCTNNKPITMNGRTTTAYELEEGSIYTVREEIRGLGYHLMEVRPPADDFGYKAERFVPLTDESNQQTKEYERLDNIPQRT